MDQSVEEIVVQAFRHTLAQSKRKLDSGEELLGITPNSDFLKPDAVISRNTTIHKLGFDGILRLWDVLTPVSEQLGVDCPDIYDPKDKADHRAQTMRIRNPSIEYKSAITVGDIVELFEELVRGQGPTL